jgi:hypothetical protein
MFPFKVETDVNKNQLAFFRKELQTEKGFSSRLLFRRLPGVQTIISTWKKHLNGLMPLSVKNI